MLIHKSLQLSKYRLFVEASLVSTVSSSVMPKGPPAETWIHSNAFKINVLF